MWRADKASARAIAGASARDIMDAGDGYSTALVRPLHSAQVDAYEFLVQTVEDREADTVVCR